MDGMDVSHVINNLVNALIPIGICVVLPIIVVKLITRERINRDNMRKDIILAAMEKNADIDIEEMMKKLNRPKKLLKERLLTKLLIGSILAIFGIFVIVAMAVFWNKGNREDIAMPILIAAVPAFAIGIAFLINYFIGKKMLAKEMEAEEQNLCKK